MLSLADLVHGGMEMFGHMELAEDDLGLSGRQGRLRGLDVGLPHVHGDRLDAPPAGRG